MTIAKLAGVSALASLSAAPRPRGVAGSVRADPSDPKALITALANAFEEFKAADAASARDADILIQNKLTAINETMSTLEASINDAHKRLAASSVLPGDMPATDPEYLAGFKAHMRTGDVSASMKESVPADGGYLAPVEWDRTLTGRLKLRSPIRENAQVITVSGGGFKRVYTDRVIGSGWVGETAARAETATPGFSELSWSFGEMYANPALTQTLLDDAAIDLETWLAGEVEAEFSIQENAAFLTGDGTNKPRGLLNYVTGGSMATYHPFGAITATIAASATTLTSDEVYAVIYALPAERQGNARFYMNRSTVFALRKLKDSTNNYLWQPSLAEGQPSTLAGQAVVEVPGMAAIATGTVPILYGDMAQTYLVVDRVGIRVMRDPFTNKPYIHFYTTKRVGGGVQNPEYMKALKMA